MRSRLLGIVTSLSLGTVAEAFGNRKDDINYFFTCHGTRYQDNVSLSYLLFKGLPNLLERFVMGQTNRPGSRALHHPYPPRYCVTLSDGSHGALSQMQF